MTPNFSRAQSEATKLLLQQNFTSLHIDVRNFHFDKNIIIDSVQHYAKIVGRTSTEFICSELSGCYVIKVPKHDLNIILYDDNEIHEERKHWGIAHEIGHIYLEHTSDGQIEEIEAHYFAAQIIMPEIVLLYYSSVNDGTINTYDIYNNFNCSLESASKRIRTLSSNVWSFTNNDKELLLKFKPIINDLFGSKVSVNPYAPKIYDAL